MCLNGNVWATNRYYRFLQRKNRKQVTVYKVVRQRHETEYYISAWSHISSRTIPNSEYLESIFYNHKWVIGLNVPQSLSISTKIKQNVDVHTGIHVYTTRKEAIKENGSFKKNKRSIRRLIKVKVNPDDLIACNKEMTKAVFSKVYLPEKVYTEALT